MMKAMKLLLVRVNKWNLESLLVSFFQRKTKKIRVSFCYKAAIKAIQQGTRKAGNIGKTKAANLIKIAQEKKLK